MWDYSEPHTIKIKIYYLTFMRQYLFKRNREHRNENTEQSRKGLTVEASMEPPNHTAYRCI